MGASGIVPRGPAEIWGARAFRMALLALTALFLGVRHGYPILAWPDAIHDDALFVRAIGSILTGDWLGPYDGLTLTKGPLLSMLGAVAAALDIWVKTLEAWLYAGMVLLFALVGRRLGMGRVLVLLAVVLLFANPHLWSSAGARFLRDVLYSLLAVTFLLCLMLLAARPRPLWRQGAWGVAVGLLAGLLILTREEDVWMAPSAVAIVGFAVAGVLLVGKRPRLLQAAGAALVALAGAGVGGALAVGPVLLLNQHAYGRAIVSEFRAPEFRAAIGALMRVGDRHESPYVSVSQAALASVFSLSPTAATLQPVWPPVSRGWSHVSRSVRPEGSDEVAGGWFVWAFREAASEAGHHRSAEGARQFYGRVADEVNAACDSGALRCRARRDTFAPEVGWRHLPALALAGLRAVLHIARQGSDDIIIQRGLGDDAKLAVWADVIGAVIPEPRRLTVLSGWLSHDSRDPALTVPADGTSVIRHMRVWPAPDVVAAAAAQGRTVRALRFAVTLECAADPCAVMATTDGGGRHALPLFDLASGALDMPAPWTGYLEEVRREDRMNRHGLGPELQAPYKLAVVAAAVTVAQWVTPALALAATVGVLAFGLRWRRRPDLWWLAALVVAAALAVLSRAAIIGYIDVTSWRAVDVTYLGPAYPFMVIYAVAGTALLAALGRASPGREPS